MQIKKKKDKYLLKRKSWGYPYMKQFPQVKISKINLKQIQKNIEHQSIAIPAVPSIKELTRPNSWLSSIYKNDHK